MTDLNPLDEISGSSNSPAGIACPSESAIYWVRSNSASGLQSPIDTEEEFNDWLDSAHPTDQCELMRGEDLIAKLDLSYAEDVSGLIAAIGEVQSPDPEHFDRTILEVYTNGDCDVFAVALQAIMGGSLVAVTNPKDERGNSVRKPYLVHAGVYSLNNVFDIEGKHEEASWSLKWRESGGCALDGETTLVTNRRIQALQSTKHTPDEIARATGIAWLIASLTGAVMPETFSSMRQTHIRTSDISPP